MSKSSTKMLKYTLVQSCQKKRSLLGQARAARKKEVVASAPEASSGAPKVDAKAQRRAAAEQRQLLAPLKKAAEKLEKELNKVSDLNAEVENALADSSLYEAASRDRLKELLNRQAEYRQQIAQLEEDWLMAQEELEALQQELGNS